jgi:hypothetical protein
MQSENEGEIEDEIEESENFKSEVQKLILKINNKLNKNFRKEVSLASTSVASSSAVSQTANIRLPRLEVPKLSGKVHEWQEFWDGFTSAIHENGNLNDVDKFSYLRGLLLEPARSTVGIVWTKYSIDVNLYCIDVNLAKTYRV